MKHLNQKRSSLSFKPATLSSSTTTRQRQNIGELVTDRKAKMKLDEVLEKQFNCVGSRKNTN